MLMSYLAERFPPRLFLPLAIVIALAASGGEVTSARLGGDAAFALLLLAQFRAWDDLADRHVDARTHPERVLVRAASVAPVRLFVASLASLNIVAAVARDASGFAAIALVALIVALGVWYATRTTRTAAGDLLVLSKYASMVVIIAGGDRIQHAPATILVAALACQVAACVYEVWHDPASPLAFGSAKGGSR